MKPHLSFAIILIVTGITTSSRSKPETKPTKEPERTGVFRIEAPSDISKNLSETTELTDVDKSLLKAVKALDIVGIREALSQGANPNASHIYTSDGGNPIGLICSQKGNSFRDETKYIEILELLVNAGATVSGRHMDTNMHDAIENGHRPVVEFLLNNGVDPRGNWANRETFVELAEQYSQQEIVDLLRAYGAIPISHQQALQFRLIQATMRGTLKDVHQAVKNGASPKLPTRLKETALIQLLMWGFGPVNLECYAKLSYLLQEGADVNFEGVPTGFRPNEGIPYTALAVTVSYMNNRRNPETDYLYEMILNALIRAGADVNAQGLNNDRTTPLHSAVNADNITAVEILLDAKADATICDHGYLGFSPIHYAVDNIPILKKFIASGADLSIQAKGTGGSTGDTPLHIAVIGNHYRAAELLLEGGADIRIKNSDGKTPLDYAKSTEMIELLKSHGAKEQE